ncbi:MAG: serine/threonine protein kinase [Planctomycetales bacterium]|nr:serine/threonine protein kinase [Planctomycetales bacterium]
MAQPTASEYLEMIRRSGLVDSTRLRSAVQRYKDSQRDRLSDELAPLLEFLLRECVLTPWQAEMLRDRKYKGFFLGKYRLLERIGSGGMSTVYLAEHIHMQRRVAIKVLPKKRVADTSFLARFYREAQAAATMDHPNIVRAYDVDQQDATHYLVMEYIDGLDLQETVLQSDRPLACDLAAYYIYQAALGLQHAHDHGLVHRDIKPANLLIDKDHRLKLLDLGLARFDDHEAASLTVAYDERVLGTADYLSPEQALNSHDVDARGDIYSLGCTLYFALTGHPPFPAGSLAQRIAKHQTAEPADLRDERPDCPASLAAICRHMMRKRPEERFQSAHEAAQRLAEWLRDYGSDLSLGLDGIAQVLPAIASQHVREANPVANSTPPAHSSGNSGSEPVRDDSPQATAPAQPVAVPPAFDDPVLDDADRNDNRQTIHEQDSIVDQRQDAGFQVAAAPSHVTVKNDVPAGQFQSEPASLLAERELRRGRGQKPPLMLWIVMGLLTLTAIGLTIYVALWGR